MKKIDIPQEIFYKEQSLMKFFDAQLLLCGMYDFTLNTGIVKHF